MNDVPCWTCAPRGAIASLLVLLLGIGMTRCAPKVKKIEGDVALAVQQGLELGTGAFDHSRFDAILRRYAKEERRQFDYTGLKAQEAELDDYLEQVARADLAKLSRNELLAFFINAYNAYTLKTILKTMTPERPSGVASIRDVPDVFDAKNHQVGGFTVSLNNMEHNILRPFFKDPRVHFAVNCASVSCPPLAGSAYTGEGIDEQLEAAARRTLQSPEYIRIDHNRLLVSKILDWYGSDFLTEGYHGAASSPAQYIARYATDEVRQFLAARGGKVTIEFMSYDWSLNKAS